MIMLINSATETGSGSTINGMRKRQRWALHKQAQNEKFYPSKMPVFNWNMKSPDTGQYMYKKRHTDFLLFYTAK